MKQIKLFINMWSWAKLEPEVNDWLRKHPNIKNVQLNIYGMVLAILYEIDE